MKNTLLVLRNLQNVRNWTAALLFVATLGGTTVTIAASPTTFACTDRVLTFPAWYRGLQDAQTCDIKSPADVGGIKGMATTIALNITELILQLVGYASVVYIMVGGFKYMTSAGSADGMVKARKTILNAVIGLVISIFSVAIVNLIAGSIN